MSDQDRPTVLIVEDVQASRDELCRIVESLGYRALGAGSGIEGLRLIRELGPSLVLLDIVMPVLDGYKVTSMIKALPGFIPVVLLTGLNDLESKKRGQAAGADDFVSKPVVPLELQIRLAAMMRIKNLHNELEAANRRLAELAETDPLTALPNRRGFEARLTIELLRTRRHKRELSLLMVDIDHFKKVNDTYGHPAGDAVLRAVGRAMAVTLRATDHIGRLGGEEFAIVAPETGAEGGMQLAERLRKHVEELRINTDVGTIAVTISLGLVTWNGETPAEMAELLKRADEALYRAKQTGRNRAVAAPLQT